MVVQLSHRCGENVHAELSCEDQLAPDGAAHHADGGHERLLQRYSQLAMLETALLSLQHNCKLILELNPTLTLLRFFS